jgi:hypothetical protein
MYIPEDELREYKTLFDEQREFAAANILDCFPEEIPQDYWKEYFYPGGLRFESPLIVAYYVARGREVWENFVVLSDPAFEDRDIEHFAALVFCRPWSKYADRAGAAKYVRFSRVYKK